MQMFFLDEIIELCRLEFINTFVIGRGVTTLEKWSGKLARGALRGGSALFHGGPSGKYQWHPRRIRSAQFIVDDPGTNSNR